MITLGKTGAEGDKSDEDRTAEVREEHRLDATTKRHYNHPVLYEWDERKRATNLKKHNLDFASADLVFESDLKVTMVSGKGRGEGRFVDYAKIEEVVLALIYTLRNDTVRIISFRPAKRKERRAYSATFKNR